MEAVAAAVLAGAHLLAAVQESTPPAWSLVFMGGYFVSTVLTIVLIVTT